MDVFTWNKNLETGIAAVDQQHQHMMEVINTFGNLLALNDVNSHATEELFDELVAYTKYHFSEEEKLMKAAGLEAQHLENHQRQHQGFIEEVSLMHDEIDCEDGCSGRNLFEFLINWLVYHILGTDKSMARQLAAIESGQQAEKAFKCGEKEAESSTELLLMALHNLFTQVSERNSKLVELNQTLEEKVEERTRALSEANQQLKELATTDALTDLPNRRHAIYMLQQLWQEAVEHHRPLACMMIDADGFKEINDNYGHDAGDIVLRELAKQLTYAVRTDDIVCRLGGDEFLILCPNTDQAGAFHVAQFTHARIAALSVPVPGGAWQGSISVGVGVRTALMKAPEDLIKAADQSVYAAKASGKNCVKNINAH